MVDMEITSAGREIVTDIPADLAEAEALSQTASANLDAACAQMKNAQDLMMQANRAYIAANEEWERAMAELRAADDRLVAERKAAGLVVTASGYARR